MACLGTSMSRRQVALGEFRKISDTIVSIARSPQRAPPVPHTQNGRNYNVKRFASLLAIAAAVVLMLPSTPASAAAAAAVNGFGFILPGLPTTGTAANHVTFDGIATGTFGTTTGACSVHFDGNGVDTLATANGGGSATCRNGYDISINCSLSYSRTGATVTVSGGCSGTVSGGLTGAFQLVPTNANPTNAYQLAGIVTIN
jgi:hypothetical protein